MQNNFSNSTEKNYARDKLVISFFRELSKNRKNMKVLELIDTENNAIKKYKLFNPKTNIIGVTLGDQKPKQTNISIYHGSINKLIKSNEFIKAHASTFNYINLDFYGPGRYFDYSFKSYSRKFLFDLIKFQKDKNSFGLTLTFDMFDDLPPRLKNQNFFDISFGLTKKNFDNILRFVKIKNKHWEYLYYVTALGIYDDLSKICNKFGFSVKLFSKPICYIGKSSNHISQMLVISFYLNKGKIVKDLDINYIKKMEFL